MPCEQAHWREARSMSCWQNFRVVPSNFFPEPFQYFQIIHLVDSLSSWYKFIINNPSNIKKVRNIISILHLDRRILLAVANRQVSIVHFAASFQVRNDRPMCDHLWWHGPKFCHASPKGLDRLWLFFAFLFGELLWDHFCTHLPHVKIFN